MQIAAQLLGLHAAGGREGARKYPEALVFEGNANLVFGGAAGRRDNR